VLANFERDIEIEPGRPAVSFYDPATTHNVLVDVTDVVRI
jgi:hypothetical protein